MPTIQELVDAKKSSASSTKQGLRHSMPEYGEIDALLVSGNKRGVMFKIKDENSALTFALIKLVNAFNDVLLLNEEAKTDLQTIKRSNELGYCVTLINELPTSRVIQPIKYMVKRTNTVTVGKTGKFKRRTIVKFMLPFASVEESAMTKALYKLEVHESNGCEQFYPIITGSPVCSIHRSEALTTISVEI